jgi:hypothetical protein
MFTSASRQGSMLWRDLCAAIKTEMAWAMKQNDRAKGSERAVALMVERIKSTTTSSLIHCELSCIYVENTNLITEGLDSLVEVSEICRDGVGSALLSSVDFEDARGQCDKCCHGEND